MKSEEYDYIVIGSGFGGSVSSLRLMEKGYKVLLLEQGRRYRTEDFPKTNWWLSKSIWLPFLKFFGILNLTFLRHVLILSGAGVGGGSLVYAATLIRPKDEVFEDPIWKELDDWKGRMPKYYALAKKMLGVSEVKNQGTFDHRLRKGAESFSDYAKNSFYTPDVGIHIGTKDKEVKDPYFDGKGPKRVGCTECGGCMVGCRYHSKNTLDKNYLHLAENLGLEINPLTKVVGIKELPDNTYEVHTVKTGTWFFKRKRIFKTKGIVLSAGVLGTNKLLLELKRSGRLGKISHRLGDIVRTNSESIIGVRFKDQESKSDGVAINSGFYLDKETHVEAVRYSKGSGALSLLCTPIPKDSKYRRLRWLYEIITSPLRYVKAASPFSWASKTLILLVMQPMDNYMKLTNKRSFFSPFFSSLSTDLGEGTPPPVLIPKANEYARHLAKMYKGIPITSFSEILFKMPTTAHILGGAVMASHPNEGVIDGQNRLFGYKNFYVIDGSMISANLGVNPSLTITALAERAMDFIPPKNS